MAEVNRTDPIGLPLDRVDGHLKVTGKATYAFEYATQGGAAYGVIVPAAIATGRVVAVDVRDAQRAPGVLLVLTKDNAPPQSPWGPVDLPDRFARAEPALDTDAVRYFGFPVAFVVAETFEHATAAAALVHVRYESSPGQYDLHAAGPTAEDPGRISDSTPADSSIGDFEAAFAAAPVKIEAVYTTPYQNQAPMEPHATMAMWEGEMLTVHTSAQLTTSPQRRPRPDIQHFQGERPHHYPLRRRRLRQQLTILCRRDARSHRCPHHRRPVKVAMTRPQLFHMTTHRTASEQRLRLGADRNGRLTAYGQDALVQCARFDKYVEPVLGAPACSMPRPTGLAGIASRNWTCRGRIRCALQGTRLAFFHSNARWTSWPKPSGSIRWSSGCATTRRSIPNGTSHSPRVILPRRCARVPLVLVGTNATKPASVRDGRWLIGLGVASGIRGDVLRNATARARLESDGRLIVELAMTDIGTGAYTILTQIAAETMELPVERVTVRLGDTRFPPTAGSGGSFGAATSGAAVLAACRKLKDGLA